MNPSDRHPYVFGIDPLVSGAGVTPDEAWRTEVVARQAEAQLKGLIHVHIGMAQAECRQLRIQDNTQCDWKSKPLIGRTDYLPRRARQALGLHLRVEHAYMGEEAIRTRIRATTDILHDWSRGIRSFSE